MFKPKTDEETLAQQNREIDKLHRQKKRYDKQAERSNKKKGRYDANTGHGIAIMSDEKPTQSPDYRRAVVAEKEKRAETIRNATSHRDQSKESAKKAKKEAEESKRRMIGRKIMDGKGIGIVVYNEKGEQVGKGKVSIKDPRDGKVKTFSTEARIPNEEIRRNEEAVRAGRSMTVDEKNVSKVIYPKDPTPKQYKQYMKNSARTDIPGVDAPSDAVPTTGGKTRRRGKTSKGKGKTTDKADSKTVHKQIMDRADIPENMRDHFIVAGMSKKSTVRSPKTASDGKKKTTNRAEVIKSVQEHIIENFDDLDESITSQQAFVEQMDYLMGPKSKVKTPEAALDMMCDDGFFLVYNSDIQNFLREIGVDDGKEHGSDETFDLYKHLIVRDGNKLYRKLKASEKKNTKKTSKGSSCPSKSPKRR